MTLTFPTLNPFMLGIAVLNLASSLWFFSHGAPLMGVSLLSGVVGSTAQALVSQ
jgi:hypothetical protein